MRDGAGEQPRSAGARIVHVLGALDREQRLAGVAAALLFATMLLPWYQQNAIVSASKTAPLVSRNLSAFAVFSFVEAAVLLVAVAVLVLLFARAEGHAFQLPGSDGSVVLLAGLWTALLLVLRLFDKPGITHNGVAANVGIQWGIFFALAAAGLLAYSGSRMRAARRPEPPLMRTDPVARRPRRTTAATRGEPQPGWEEQRPGWEEPQPSWEEPQPGLEGSTPRPERPPFPPAPTARPRQRPAAPDSANQLSFEDSPPME
jgi:hypothetical protein